VKEKCNKYEAYFIFANEDDFKRHLSECEDCALEHQEAQKISALVKEAKPYYRQMKKRHAVFAKICASFFLVLTLFAGGISYDTYSTNEYIAQAYMEEYGSEISDMGFPVDEYGLLLAD